MRTINRPLVDAYADELRAVLPLARRAVGTQRADSPPRLASNRANELIIEYVEKGGNITHLANALEGTISYPGLRRRLRAARGRKLGDFSSSRKRGSTDPVRVAAAVERIRDARDVGGNVYRTAVREVYSDNVSLTAVAKELDVSYHSLWSAGSTG